MRSLLWTSLAATSMLLCIATVVMWFRSKGTYDSLDYQGSRQLHRLVTVHGDLCVALVDRAANPPEPAIGWSWTSEPPPNPSWDRMWNRPDYAKRFVVSGIVRGKYYSTVLFPLWFVSLVLLILPAVWVRQRYRRRTRMRTGLCAHCGYDLRASPDQCPECGAVTEHGRPAVA